MSSCSMLRFRRCCGRGSVDVVVVLVVDDVEENAHVIRCLMRCVFVLLMLIVVWSCDIGVGTMCIHHVRHFWHLHDLRQ